MIDFLLDNTALCGLKDEPENARVLPEYVKAFILTKKWRSGLKMAKYVHSKDKKVYEAVINELEHFQKLVKRYDKLLKAIGEL